MKDLPKVYQANIKKKMKNNKEMCVVKEVEEKKNDVQEILQMVHTGLGNYNTKIILITKDGEYDTTLIAKNTKEVMTKENKLIPIKDIIDIKIKK